MKISIILNHRISPEFYYFDARKFSYRLFCPCFNWFYFMVNSIFFISSQFNLKNPKNFFSNYFEFIQSTKFVSFRTLITNKRNSCQVFCKNVVLETTSLKFVVKHLNQSPLLVNRANWRFFKKETQSKVYTHLHNFTKFLITPCFTEQIQATDSKFDWSP